MGFKQRTARQQEMIMKLVDLTQARKPTWTRLTIFEAKKYPAAVIVLLMYLEGLERFEVNKILEME
jgi:hypothetical protein